MERDLIKQGVVVEVSEYSSEDLSRVWDLVCEAAREAEERISHLAGRPLNEWLEWAERELKPTQTT